MTTAFSLIDQVTDTAITRARLDCMTPAQTARFVRLLLRQIVERMRTERLGLYERFARSLEAQTRSVDLAAPYLVPGDIVTVPSRSTGAWEVASTSGAVFTARRFEDGLVATFPREAAEFDEVCEQAAADQFGPDDELSHIDPLA